MTTRRRMIATDLDGTLLQPDGTVSPRSAAALELARRNGLLVTLVTGRPPRWLAPVANQTGWHGYAAAANGAVLIDLDKRVVEETFPIAGEAANEAVARIREFMPGATFGVENVRAGTPLRSTPTDNPYDQAPLTNTEFGHEPGFRARLGIPIEAPVAPIADLIARGDVVKLLARGPDGGLLDPDDTMVQLTEVLAGVVTVTHSTPSSVLLELSAATTSKESGVAWLAKTHGIAREDVIAVGDMPNDLPMLRWAGEGWAVGNAHAHVLAEVGADRILPPHTEDGVAGLIERIAAASGDSQSA
ncbi:MAG: HAD hydrolase family protein [Candidatus Nanopelagicales bacterium]